MVWIESYSDRLKELANFLKLEKKIIVHHRDVDGACSAAQFLKIFPDFKTFSIKDPFVPDHVIAEIIEIKPDLILFVDIGVDEHWQRLAKLQEGLPKAIISVIDHHTIQKDLANLGMLHINPRLQNPKAYIPASLMVYDILDFLEFDVKPFSWIACIGVISDYGQKDNRGFIELCKSQYPELLDAKELIESKLGYAAKSIYSAIIVKGEYGIKKSMDILVRSKSFSDFEKDTDMKKWKKIIDVEIEKVMEDVEKDKEIIGNVLFFEIKSKFNLAAIVANIISEKYKDKIAVIGKNVNGGWKVSTRLPKAVEVRTSMGQKINLAEVVSKSVEGIGYGGGHPQAAGAFIEDWEEFKRRVVKNVNV